MSKFESIRDRLLKASSNKGAARLDKSDLFNVVDMTMTNIPILNIALSGEIAGGLASGISVAAGPSKHFKTTIALKLVSAYLEKYEDAICLFFDIEFGTPPDYVRSAGIDPARVLHIPCMNVEELKFYLFEQLEAINRGDRVIFVIDSVGNAASKKEIDDAKDHKSVADMTRAKALKSLFRIITPYFRTKNVPCVAINHTIETIEMFSKTVMTGGCVVEGTEIRMADGTYKEVQNIEPGEHVHTLTGSKQVTHSWNPETLMVGTPECIEVEFDDGFTVTTSDTHKFLVMNNDIPSWVEAKDLKPNDEIVTI